jgi:type II secretory pathway pseudopilin PulG
MKLRSAFTVIELLLIIIILGILASVALTRLSATRDDARKATDASNVSMCLKDVITAYTAAGTTPAKTVSSACATIESVVVTDDVVTVTGKVSPNQKSATFKGTAIASN